MRGVEKFLIFAVVAFCLFISIYVSIPDYPKSARAWEIMLWSDSSGWWSELCWILVFGISAVLTILFHSWNRDFKIPEREWSTERIFYVLWMLAFLSVTWNYSAIYFRWLSWHNTIVVDATGYLHGLFYAWSLLTLVLAVGEGTAYLSKLHHHLIRRRATW